MELPTKPIPATRILPKILYLYGQPKIGKTTILSQLPNCLIIECDEGGADFVEALKVQISNMTDFMELTKKIIDAGKPYKYIALDTATKFEEWCEEQATKDYKASTVGKNFTGLSVLQLPDGAGYLWLRLAFQRAMQRLIQCADHIILTGHLKDKFLKSTDKDKGKGDFEVASKDIDHTGKIKAMICAAADAIGFLYRTSNQDGTVQKLKVSFKTHEMINCGCRCQHLINQDFEFDWNKIYPPTPSL